MVTPVQQQWTYRSLALSHNFSTEVTAVLYRFSIEGAIRTLINKSKTKNQNRRYSLDENKTAGICKEGAGVSEWLSFFWHHDRQDRRWKADKPSAALDPYIPTWLTTSPANHRPTNFWFFFFYIQRKLWKVVQPQVQLMSINFKFEVPILWLFKVQIIINIIY